MTDEPIRLAILGCGTITRIEHFPSVLAHPDVRLAALVDLDLNRAKILAKSRQVDCEIVTDYRSLVGKVDALINALPNSLHAPLTLEALDTGIHVLCEKPLATSSADATACAEIAKRKNLVLAVGMSRRFVASHTLLRLVLDEGLLGSLQDYDFQYGGAFDWRSASGFYFSKQLAGGGALLDFGVHLLDSLMDWFGPVSAFDYQDDNWGSGIEANAFVDLRHLGTYGDINGRVRVSRTYPLKNRLLVRGTKGQAEISLHDLEAVVIHRIFQGRPVTETVRIAKQGGAGSFFRQLDNFVESIRGRQKPEVDGFQAARVLQLIEDCYAHAHRIPEPWSDVQALGKEASI
ncbi:MAG: hypothetical protein DMG97_10915 [Acidobacteria bacterium]|nr:MAG: hypothetical protein DME33_14680 [Verrucomicrobiota bacterium]PYV73605.1 MAG: hypothetical protein DMG97_10915 [Acidobacteriota bacterium]